MKPYMKLNEYMKNLEKIGKEYHKNTRKFISTIFELVDKNIICEEEKKQDLMTSLKILNIWNEHYIQTTSEIKDALTNFKRERFDMNNIIPALNTTTKQSNILQNVRAELVEILSSCTSDSEDNSNKLKLAQININKLQIKFRELINYNSKIKDSFYNFAETMHPVLKHENINKDFKKNKIEKVGSAKVNIHIILDHKIDGYQLYSKFIEIKKSLIQQQKQLSKEENKSVKSKDFLNMEELYEILHNTITQILVKNPKIIKTSNVNIYAVLRINFGEGIAGQYLSNRSNYSNIFINILFKSEVIVDYLLGKKMLRSRMGIYDTIVHELIHAEDQGIVETSDDEMQDLTTILKETPLQETLAFANIIKSLRTEGLARIGSKLRSLQEIPIDFLKYVDNMKQEIITFFEHKISPAGVNNNIVNEVHALYRSGTLHILGEYMCLIIMIYKFKHKLAYRRFGRVFKGPNSYSEGFIPVAYSEIGHYFGKDNTLDIPISNLTENDKNNFFTYIKNLNPVQFFQVFEKACKELKIDSSPISLDLFLKINKKAKEQFEAYLKAEGF